MSDLDYIVHLEAALKARTAAAAALREAESRINAILAEIEAGPPYSTRAREWVSVNGDANDLTPSSVVSIPACQARRLAAIAANTTANGNIKHCEASLVDA
jgi:hypothetical protein